MEKVVYTNYWVDRYTDARKEHGSYLTEEEALNAIYTWWRIHKEHHRDVKETRTNTGALEITYDDTGLKNANSKAICQVAAINSGPKDKLRPNVNNCNCLMMSSSSTSWLSLTATVSLK